MTAVSTGMTVLKVAGVSTLFLLAVGSMAAPAGAAVGTVLTTGATTTAGGLATGTNWLAVQATNLTNAGVALTAPTASGATATLTSAAATTSPAAVVTAAPVAPPAYLTPPPNTAVMGGAVLDAPVL